MTKNTSENKRNFITLEKYQDDIYVCLQKNGYRNVFCFDNKTEEEVMKHLEKDLKGKIITEDTATTDEQKKLLKEMKDFTYNNYVFPRRFETEPFFNAKRAQYKKERN